LLIKHSWATARQFDKSKLKVDAAPFLGKGTAMANLDFNGLAGSNFGTSFFTLNQTLTVSGAGSDVVGSDDGFIAITFILGSNGLSGASSASYNFSLIYMGGTSYAITAITATYGNGTVTQNVVSLTGTHIKVSLNSTNVFDTANSPALGAAFDRMLSGDDFMAISGTASVVWGDYATVPTKGGIMGDDIIVGGGAIVLASGPLLLLVVGDALTVQSGVTAQGGNDIIRMLSTSVSCRIFGDFQTVSGNAHFGNDVIYGGNGADTIFGDTNIGGVAGGKDWLFGATGADQLFGGGGNDRLNGGSGTFADTLNGGPGFDIASYVQNSTFSATMIADLADSSQNTFEAAGDTYVSIEGLAGRRVGDDLRGDAKANIIFGYQGTDTLTGRAGNDTLIGGSEGDVFVFDSTLNAKTNVDLIKDFSGADDIIALNFAIFKAPSTGGVLKTSAFQANLSGQAEDGTDRIIYETDTGKLFYDADGIGGADGVLFAILGNKATLTAADFTIV